MLCATWQNRKHGNCGLFTTCCMLVCFAKTHTHTTHWNYYLVTDEL